MSTIAFTLRLISDGEIGSGLGNETINDIVARDHEGLPVVRGSHLKGLLRAGLDEIVQARGWSPVLGELCFGRGGAGGDDGAAAMSRLSDARAEAMPGVRTITRTSLGDLGVATGMTLRTTEAVGAGAVFSGMVTVEASAPPAVELAVRLALFSLEAVGGGRTRGSGACVVDVAGEKRGPGDLLRALDAEIRAGLQSRPRVGVAPAALAEPADAPAVTLRLVFDATDPVCCPETPVLGNNAIRSGLSIPASAVQGAIITRLASVDPALAHATLLDRRTRAWPLLPSRGANGDLPFPVRVALSHRMSKLENEQHDRDFRDAAIEPYDWRTADRGSPLKSVDGILLRDAAGHLSLWSGRDLPRIVTAHAVHHDPTGRGERNLFTVEALAPTTFSGLVSLPPQAAALLQESLRADPSQTFGKARTVRGGGNLTASPVAFDRAFLGWQPTVFVLQSPAAIPDDWEIESERAEITLARLVRESGWGSMAEASRAKGIAHVVTQASCGVRFGWNRHGLGKGVAATRRLSARRVFLPGTVFVLAAVPNDLSSLLIRGLGVVRNGDVDGREQGYGAVLPHPGIAIKKVPVTDAPQLQLGSDGAGRLAYDWWQKSKHEGPSPSQISAVAERIKADGKAAIEYLRIQKEGRAQRVWRRWASVYDDVRQAIAADHTRARTALLTWRDLAIINRSGEER
jgi:hypothetical protein